MSQMSIEESNSSCLEENNTSVTTVNGAEVQNTHNEQVAVHKVYACELCSATFNRHANYTRHKMIHSVHPKVCLRI